jgi:hypothetical protein
VLQKTTNCSGFNKEKQMAIRARQAEEDAAAKERNLRSQMDLLKSSATSAELGMDCAACRLKLSGLVVRVNGSTLYHEKCFTCKTCAQVFDQFYFPHRNVPYCQRHYLEAADLKCAKCRDLIVDEKAVSARGQKSVNLFFRSVFEKNFFFQVSFSVFCLLRLLKAFR